jgi:plasmid stabilization system protein ParE
VKRLFFHPAAAEDAENAAAWYAGEGLALGLDFQRELAAAINRLRGQPAPWTPFLAMPTMRRVRKLAFHRFPYFLVFVERDGACIVLAVAHAARRPGYWKARLRR